MAFHWKRVKYDWSFSFSNATYLILVAYLKWFPLYVGALMFAERSNIYLNIITPERNH